MDYKNTQQTHYVSATKQNQAQQNCEHIVSHIVYMSFCTSIFLFKISKLPPVSLLDLRAHAHFETPPGLQTNSQTIFYSKFKFSGNFVFM